MKYLKKFNESLENLDIYKKELQKKDDSGIFSSAEYKEIDKKRQQVQ